MWVAAATVQSDNVGFAFFEFRDVVSSIFILSSAWLGRCVAERKGGSAPVGLVLGMPGIMCRSPHMASPDGIGEMGIMLFNRDILC